LKVDILHLNFQWESLDIEGEVAIVWMEDGSEVCISLQVMTG
jgi:hypothetical protein